MFWPKKQPSKARGISHAGVWCWLPIGALLLAAASSQIKAGIMIAWSRVPSVSEQLSKKGIALDKGSLMAALRNADPDVRVLAAFQLASENDRDAIPAIRDALTKESTPDNQLNLAFDLARLGDALGKAQLKSACSSPKLPGHVRMLAAQNMLALGDNTCLSDVISVLKYNDDWLSMTAALSLVPQYFSGAGPDIKNALIDLTSQAVSNSLVQVRLAAANTLAMVGSAAAIPILESAIAKETNKETQLAMEQDLRSLHNKLDKIAH